MIDHYGADPKIPISRAVRAGDWVFVSGQASTDLKTGAFIRGTFEEEFLQTIANLRAVISEVEACFDQVVRVGAYVRDESALPEFNRLYLREFSHPRPARTTSAIGFEFLQIEIDAVLYLG